MLDTVLGAARLQSRAPSVFLIGFVSIDRSFVAHYERIGDLALVGLGSGEHPAADQPRALVNADMGLVAEEQPPRFAFPRPIGVRIVRRAAFLVAGCRARRRRSDRAPNQRGVDQKSRSSTRTRPPPIASAPPETAPRPARHPSRHCWNRHSVVSSGVAASSANPQNRRNDTRSSSASSSAGSDRSYICCRSSAFNIDIAA